MAISFVKDVNGKVIVDRNGTTLSLDPSMNIIPAPNDSNIIIITDTSAPMEAREVLKFGWSEVTTPTASDRNDLIEQLGADYFFQSTNVSISGEVEIKNDSGNPVPVNVQNPTDVSALNLEATQLLVKGVLDLIKAKTDNLDVALSTRLNTLGQKTMANSAPVVIASDQSAIPVSGSFSTLPQTHTTETLSSITVTNASTTLAASNVNRKSLSIWNDSGAQIYVKFGTLVTTAAFKFRLSNNDYYEMPSGSIYTGEITAIRGAGSGTVLVSEG